MIASRNMRRNYAMEQRFTIDVASIVEPELLKCREEAGLAVVDEQ